MTELLHTITLKYARLEIWTNACFTKFEDGLWCPSEPQDTDHYNEITRRCGYYIGPSPTEMARWRYCVEHDFAHSFIEERMYDRPSRVLRGIARGWPLSGPHAAYEEFMAQGFQRWLHTNERPIIGGVDWDQLKKEALEKLNYLWS